MRQMSCTFVIVAALALMSSPAFSENSPRLYAVIIANNQSLDPELPPLRFADDDGAKYFELFEAAGAETTLLTVLDPDAQKRFPHAQAAAVPPKEEALLNALDTIFAQIERERQDGIESHFIFVYSGHGNVGANREGYINLTDTRFTRTDLFRKVLARSPADFNHVILDACHAYFMVNKRGKADKKGDYEDAVRAFLAEEALESYPNTGVILAASSESETHEWSRWESGIFSHELRSALLGAADVDTDGRVTYHEAAASVEAANAAIDIPKARLKVYYRPPAADMSAPLMHLTRFTTSKKLVMPTAMAGRYFVEDARGIRIADFNYTAEQDVTLTLTGDAPYYLRTDSAEAGIDTRKRVITAGDLDFTKRSSASRGSVERSFRRNLYQIPFGLGFYRGLQAVRDTDHFTPEHENTLEADHLPNQRRPYRILGWSLVGVGLATGLGSGIGYIMAKRSFDDYESSNTESIATDHQKTTENRLLTSRILLGAGVTMAAVGTALLIINRKKTTRNSAVEPAVTITKQQWTLGVSGAF